jgi:hypothetical protein
VSSEIPTYIRITEECWKVVSSIAAFHISIGEAR